MVTLYMITLGCVISSWADSSSIDLITAAECFVALGKCLWPENSEPKDNSSSSLLWLNLLIAAAQNLIQSTGIVRQNCIGLVEFGRRRGRRFLHESLHSSVPMFGLANPVLLFQLSNRLKDQNVDTSIRVLRVLAEQCELHKDDCLIRYTPDDLLNL